MNRPTNTDHTLPMIRPLIVVTGLALLAVASLHCRRDEPPKPESTSPHGIPIKLPRATTGQVLEATIAVTIDAKGGLSFNGLPMSEEALLAALRKARQTNQDPRVVIQADRSVSHGRVVEILDRCRTAGIKLFSVGVITAPPLPKPPTRRTDPPPPPAPQLAR